MYMYYSSDSHHPFLSQVQVEYIMYTYSTAAWPGNYENNFLSAQFPHRHVLFVVNACTVNFFLSQVHQTLMVHREIFQENTEFLKIRQKETGQKYFE